MEPRFYRLHLSLPEAEASALARLANREYRDMRAQAIYLIRQKLQELDELPRPGQEPARVEDQTQEPKP